MSWKEAASIILSFSGPKLKNGIQTVSGSELRILMMKRASRSTFMPDLYVFPGGMLDSADTDSQWLSRFPDLKTTPVPVSKHRIPLFRKYADSPMCGEIAFRLCALREAFEESGILLGAERPNAPVSMNSITEFGHDEWNDWRSRVKQDPWEFLSLYEKLRLIPDVWSLHEWSNWLTPREERKRYDTAFFMAFPRDIPAEIKVEESEMSKARILRPQQFLRMHFEKRLQLAKPQVYEMGRFCKFNTTEDLEKFAVARAKEGNVRYSVYMLKRDGKLYFLLPGDSCFPENHEHLPDIDYPETLEIREDGDLKRQVIDSDGTVKVLVTAEHYGHVKPIATVDIE